MGIVLAGRMMFVGWQYKRQRNVLSRVDSTLRMIQRRRLRYAWGPSGDSICTVCRQMPVEVELPQCQHACLCADCAIRIVQDDPRCPICREFISQVAPLES